MEKYGDLPIVIDTIKVNCNEMMFYQYLPIKLPYSSIEYEDRLNCFNDIIGSAFIDFQKTFGLEEYRSSYMYLTAKRMYQQKQSFNRHGWHSDGFMTNDINYIWCDKFPTIFNKTQFELTMNDEESLNEMEKQAMPFNDVIYPENTLLRLNQFNIHRVDENVEGYRTFVKISFSKDKYNLIGNSHNYLLDYNWKMKERKIKRNIPQSKIKK